jgi:hypothetical protein
MNLAKTISVIGATGGAAIAVAGPAGATGTPISPTTSVPKVTGAYLFIQRIQTGGGVKHPIRSPFATLVYRTDRQLPRSSDGSPDTGGASIAGQGGSIGSVHGRASRCYAATARIKPDNTITGTNAGSIIQTKAVVGSRLPVAFTTLRHGTTTHRTLTLRAQRPGDLSGKPLGC